MIPRMNKWKWFIEIGIIEGWVNQNTKGDNLLRNREGELEKVLDTVDFSGCSF